MYGKVVAASGSAYLLTFEAHVLPVAAGGGVLLLAGMVVALDVAADGPRNRLMSFLARSEQRSKATMSRLELQSEIRAAAREELKMNHGIRMPDELTEDDREWLREQAAIALREDARS